MNSMDDSNEYVSCQLCGTKLRRLQHTHLKYKCIDAAKNMSISDYVRLFPNCPTVSVNVARSTAITKSKFINMYGYEDGVKKWNEYRDKQRFSNSFEYKSEKYGWTIDDFNEFNRSRAVTLDNLCRKYGDEEGKCKFDNYRKIQQYTTSPEYFIEKYGSEEGKIRYDSFCAGRLKGSYSANRTRSRVKSQIELSCFNDLSIALSDVASITSSVILPNIFYSLKFNEYDMGIISHNILIEFYGTFWHASPHYYDSLWIHPIRKLSAKHIWHIDNMKILNANRQGYTVHIIWEHDWLKNKEKVINEIRKYFN